VIKGSKPVPAASPVAQPASSDFPSYVAGAGIIEAAFENHEIGPIVPGVVTKIFVKVGDNVKAGDPLFQIDDRDLQAELITRKAALASANAKLEKQQSLPRPEDVPAAEAKVVEAKAALSDAKNQYEMMAKVADARAVSQDELDRRKYAVDVANARLAQAQADLSELKAGAWKPDLDIAKADVTSAEASVKSIDTEIDRRMIHSPIDGQVLQVKIRTGEYAQTPFGGASQALMLVGDVSKFHVRVDVDENDAWRVKAGSAAIAYVRGNRDLKTQLQFVRFEPYVVPKKSLTGDSTERVDTRVLQVLYSFDPHSLPVYVGQQMDVFIDAPPISASSQPSLAATENP
jgi:HlyD family secretion protein